jgi:multidrug efflux pump subunit AcrB
MRKLITFFIRYPIWTNVLMVSILGFGLLCWGGMKYSFFPEIPPDMIIIEVELRGGSPEEVEEGVVLKIEENIEGIEGIERVTSVSRESAARVTVEVMKGEDVDKVLQDVKNAVDRISSFPKASEQPVIYERKYRDDVMSIVLLGDTDLFNLKYVADEMRDELLAMPEISQVTISGLPRLEFSIEVTESDLRRYLLTFDEIAEAVAAANINISGGTIETPEEEILIRTWGRKYYASQLHGLVVRGNSDGTVIRLGDIATVKEKWEDIPDKVYYNGRNAVKIKIEKTAQEDILAIAEQAKQHLANFNATHKNMQAVILNDQTNSLRQRLSLLSRNGLIGLVLVISLLGFFLNLRLSFWVSVGIPFSFAGMFIIAFLAGITINVISLMGMIIVVGILVDDAIVVGENIYSHYERGKPALDAAIDGTLEMIPPVFTSVFTTVIAFMPFFFLDGFLGKFIWNMALVVIASLLFSLVEAFLILPSHLAHSKGLHPHKSDPPIRQKIEKVIAFLTYRIYAPLLKTTLRHKWITVMAPAALVMMTVGLLQGGFIGVSFFPFIDMDTLPVNLSLVAGRQEKDTNKVLERIEKSCWQVNEDLKKERADGRDVILGIMREIGNNDFNETGSHTGKLVVRLLDGEAREMDSYLIANRIREVVGTVPEAQNISYGRFSMFGKPVSVSLLGNDLKKLRQASRLLIGELKNFTELTDITDNEQEGRREVAITLKPRAHALGLKLQEVVGQVRQGFYGHESQRIQRGRDEIRVWVRYTDQDRGSLGFLEQMRIRTPDGAEYPFSELAEYKVKRSVSRINHLNRQREITVEAALGDEGTPLLPIIQEFQQAVVPRALSQVEGVRASYEGQSREQGKVMRSVSSAFPIAFVAMFILIILVFRSYAQAGLVFSLIPLGVMGAIWGHGLQGVLLNILSLYGLIALTGIVVNDSIVLIDQINRNILTGQKIYDAVYNASISRLRPILLTTMTTSIGLAPLIFETSRQAQFLIPMAISIAYGLLFGTFILLILLPSGFLALNRVRCLWAQFIYQKPVTPESVEPAFRELAEADSLSVRSNGEE